MLGEEVNSTISRSTGGSSLLPQAALQIEPVLCTGRDAQHHGSSYYIHQRCPQRLSHPFIYCLICWSVTLRERDPGWVWRTHGCGWALKKNIWAHKRNPAAPRWSFSFRVLVNYGLPHFSPSEIPFVLCTTILLSVACSALTGDKWSVSWFTTLTLLGRVYRAGTDLFLQAKQISLLWYSAHGVLLCGYALE